MIPKEQLQIKADKMNAYLQTRASSEPQDIIDRIELLAIMISESGGLLAEANYHRDTIIHSSIMNAVKEGYAEKLTPTALNKLVSSLAKEENYLAKVFDRINASATHQLDGLRSVLSYRKQEFATLSYGK